MKTFDDFTLEEKLAHFTDVGRRALPLWGLPEDSDMKLLNFTENATFLVTPPGSEEKTIMRVHRLDYTSHDSIMTEFAWIQALQKETDVSLATPIPMQNGDLVATIHTDSLNEDRLVDCSTFMPGKPPMDSSDGNGDVGAMIAKIEKIPDSITLPLFKALASAYAWYGSVNPRSHMTKEDREMYRTVGHIMAEMHRQAEHWQKPSFYDLPVSPVAQREGDCGPRRSEGGNPRAPGPLRGVAETLRHDPQRPSDGQPPEGR